MPAVAPARNHGCVAVRLTGGVVTGRGLRGWAPGAGPLGAVSPVDAGEAELPPGTAIVVGPEDAGRAAVGAALAELAALVAAGGVEAAGAGVELAGGFRSARLAGAPGDRRGAGPAAPPPPCPGRAGPPRGPPRGVPAPFCPAPPPPPRAAAPPPPAGGPGAAAP